MVKVGIGSSDQTTTTTSQSSSKQRRGRLRPLFLVGFLALAAWNMTRQQQQSSYYSTAMMMTTPREMIPLQATDYIYSTIGWDSAPIVVESHELIFFTVPKVGCTVWKQLFRRMEGYNDWQVHTLDEANLPHNPKRNGLKYLFDYSLSDATSKLNDPSYTKAIFVRDPKDRFLSAYLDKGVRNPDWTRKKCCPTNNNRSKESDDCWPESNRSFQDFFELTKACHNQHWDPMAARLDPKFLSLIDFIGTMDQLQEDSKRLLQQIGAWAEFGSSGWGTDGTEPIFQSKSSVKHATSNSAAQAWKRLNKYYTPELERAVEERFSQDYHLYGIPRRAIEF